MKKILLLLFILSAVVATGQGLPLPDSVIKHYNSLPAKKERSVFLWDQLQSFSYESIVISKLLKIQSYFKQQNDESASDLVQLAIAIRVNRNGDYNTSLNMSLPVLSSFEERKDTFGIIAALRRISNCYEFANNFGQAVFWAKKTIPYVIALRDETELSNSYNDIGATYAKAMMVDSGLYYAQQAVNIDMRLNNENNLPYSLSTLAENYIAGKNYDLALPFLKKALVYAKASGTAWAIAYTELDLAQSYRGLNVYDSSIHYAQECITVSKNNDTKETLLKAYEVLDGVYEATNRQDSANKYFRLATAIKDSVYTIEKLNASQATSFREQLRQQELAAEKTKTEEERKNNIQYAAMAIGILCFISIFLLLSRSIIVNEKWISFLGILGLLVVFEFINLLIHPFLERVTHHSPVLMLLALVAIAALLIPLHNWLKHWINHKMVEKNKKIRLAAAKKTIEKLEKNNS
jgi:tetratricopeptide (TPR) repeat protein